MPKTIAETRRIISVGDKSLKVTGGMIAIDELIPNAGQPRLANLLDPGLRKSMLETKGLTSSLLVERLNDRSAEDLLKDLKERYKDDATILDFINKVRPKYLIIDGERRWCNSVLLLAEDPEGTSYLKELPCDILENELTERDRYVIWVSIHKIRKDWKAMEKENAARNLVKLMDPASAANILGITLPALQKFIDIHNLAQRMKKGAKERAISYARETTQLAAKIRTEEVINAVVDKVNRHLITDAVDIRKLRVILDHPFARDEFLKSNGTVGSAYALLPRAALDEEGGLKENLMAFKKIVEKYGWREVKALKGDTEAVEGIESCKKVLDEIKEAIS